MWGRFADELPLQRLSFEFENLVKQIKDKEDELSNPTVGQLLANQCFKILNQLQEIVLKAETFETPQFRQSFAERRVEDLQIERDRMGHNVWGHRQEVIVVSARKSAKDLVDILTAITSHVNEDMENIKVQFVPDLQSALDTYLENDIIVLPPGVHWALEGVRLSNVSIFGLDADETMIAIEPKTDAKGFNIHVEGGVSIQNVIFNNETPNSVNGILVHRNLMMNSCKLSNFEVSIKVMPGAGLDLTSCTLTDTKIGLDIASNVTANKTKILNCEHPLLLRNPKGDGIKFNQVSADEMGNVVVVSEVPVEASEIMKDAKLTECENLLTDHNLVTVSSYDF